MIDEDGFKRPDKPDDHMKKIKNAKRNINFDASYSYRPRNVFFKMWASFFRAFTIVVLCPFLLLSQKVKIRNRKNLKGLGRKAFIVVCNHVTVIDDLSIGTNILNTRKIYFTTLKENIKRPAVGFFLRSLGGIPIPSGSVSGMRKFEDDLSFLLQHKKPIIYNPEAAMWPKYRGVRPFKRGAFSIAVKNDVPVLPIAITMKRKKKRNGKYKYRYLFNICQTIYPDKTLSQKEASEKLLSESHQVIENVVKQFYQNEDCGFDEKDEKAK